MQKKKALKLFSLKTADNANTHTKQFSIIFLSAILYRYYEHSIDIRTKRDLVHHLFGFLFYCNEFMRKAFRRFAVYPKSVF